MKQLFDFAITDKTNRRGYVDLGKLSEEEIAKFGETSNWKNLSDTFKVSDKSDYQTITIKNIIN